VKRKIASFARRLKRLKPGEGLIVLRVPGGFAEVPRRFLPKREATETKLLEREILNGEKQ